MSVWTLRGEHVGDYRHVVWVSSIVGRADGSLVANHVPEIDLSDQRVSISAFSPVGAVDGHGHLYVYPYDPSGAANATRPVDVYSPEGEHLYSGRIDHLRWPRARGDHVYVPAYDRRSEQHHVVRYRLAEPF